MICFFCPYCNSPLKFHYNNERNLYRTVCPYCKNVLEIEKEEYETEKEVYFIYDNIFGRR